MGPGFRYSGGMTRWTLPVAIAFLGLGLGRPLPAQADVRTFETGSLVIPMDLAYQDRGLFQAYGLVFQLLRQDVRSTG